jgi:signal transduction histidine kinase
MSEQKLLLISDDSSLMEIFRQLHGFELTISPHTWYVEPSEKAFEVVIVDADFARMTENVNLVVAKSTVAFAILSPQNQVEFLTEHRRKFYDIWIRPIYPELLSERIIKALEHEALFEPFSRAIYFVWQERVNGPVAAIRGYVDVLASGLTGKLTEQQIQFLQVIKSNIQQINTNILSYSQEQEMSVITYIPWASNVDVDEVLLHMQRIFLEDGFMLELILPDKIPLIHSNRQIFYYLAQSLGKIVSLCSVDNRKISIAVSVENTEVSFTILLPCFDSLPPLTRQRISDFLPRLRSEMLANSASSSISVALISIDHYLYQVGSDVYFESEVGKGSAFYFTLPIAKDETPK